MDTEQVTTTETPVETPAKATKKAPAKATKKTPAKATKKAPAKATKKAPAKAKKATKNKPGRKAGKPAQVGKTAAFIVGLKKPMTAIAIASKLGVNGIEVHRAVMRLERDGYTVSATRSEPTGKPGRRSFLYLVTAAPKKAR